MAAGDQHASEEHVVHLHGHVGGQVPQRDLRVARALQSVCEVVEGLLEGGDGAERQVTQPGEVLHACADAQRLAEHGEVLECGNGAAQLGGSEETLQVDERRRVVGALEGLHQPVQRLQRGLLADNSVGGDDGLGVGEGLREETLVGESVGGRVGSGGESDGREEQIHLDEGGLEGAFLLLRRVLVGNILAGFGHAEEANETAVAVEEVDVEEDAAEARLGPTSHRSGVPT